MTQIKDTAVENAEDKEVERINPMFNDVFLRVFGCQDSKTATRSLVNSVFRTAGIPEIGEIDSIAAEVGVVGGSITCKSGRADIVLVSDDRIVDIEAQGYHTAIENKALFYASKLLVEYTDIATDYCDLPQVIVMILLDGRKLLSESDQIVTTGQFDWSMGGAPRHASDRIMFVLVELDKVADRYNETDEVIDDEMLSWLYLLANGYRDESEVERLMDKFPSIEEFSKLYGIAIDDPRIRKEYDLYHRQVMEANTTQKYLDQLEREAVERGEAKGLERGLERGLEQGLEQGLERAAALLVDMGLDDSAIENFKQAYQQKQS